MKILIDGNAETRTLAGTTLGEILGQIQNEQAGKGACINRVLVNNAKVDVASREVMQTPVSAMAVLEIETAPLREMAAKILANAAGYLEKLIPGIEMAAELFRSSNEQEANKFFINIIDAINWFSHLVDMIFSALKTGPAAARFDEKIMLERKKQLIEITAKMLEAHKNKDWVLVADLLEYETLPYYQEWRNYMPELQQLADKAF